MNILVTGAAGFVGNAVSLLLAKRGDSVVGIDNLNDYYSVDLKQARLNKCASQPLFSFKKLDITDTAAISALFSENSFDAVVHLAAQAGVRYSLENPYAYIDTNIKGTLNLLEACRNYNVKNFVYASSSSVYGENAKIPFSTEDIADFPVSLYAATKRSTELIAHTYSHLFGIKAIGLRYFTVYGPWGRPDMAPFIFAKNILNGKPIQVFNNGNMKRDFTFVDDIVEGTVRVLDWNANNNENKNTVFNIGRGEPVELLRFIEILEDAFGKKAIKEFLPMQAGDVPITWADTQALEKATGYKPKISLEEGVKKFAEWYKGYSI